jgi:hypothetical protein
MAMVDENADDALNGGPLPYPKRLLILNDSPFNTGLPHVS